MKFISVTEAQFRAVAFVSAFSCISTEDLLDALHMFADTILEWLCPAFALARCLLIGVRRPSYFTSSGASGSNSHVA